MKTTFNNHIAEYLSLLACSETTLIHPFTRFEQGQNGGRGGHVFATGLFEVKGETIFRSGRASQDVSNWRLSA